ncbi:TPA: hypothetical protein ACP9DH_004090, partial [Legionella anisa]
MPEIKLNLNPNRFLFFLAGFSADFADFKQTNFINSLFNHIKIYQSKLFFRNGFKSDGLGINKAVIGR